MKQRLRVSNQTQKMEVKNDVMAFFGMENDGGDRVEYAMHSIFSLYEHTDEQRGTIQEEYCNLFNE